MKIQSDYDSASNRFKKIKVIDLKKEYIGRDFTSYRKLSSAIPYIEEIVSIDHKIKNKSTIESILDELTELRSNRVNKRGDFINDLIITKFKDWDFLEDNKTRKRYEELFNYLKMERLLSTQDIELWEKEIKEARN